MLCSVLISQLEFYNVGESLWRSGSWFYFLIQILLPGDILLLQIKSSRSCWVARHSDLPYNPSPLEAKRKRKEIVGWTWVSCVLSQTFHSPLLCLAHASLCTMKMLNSADFPTNSPPPFFLVLYVLISSDYPSLQRFREGRRVVTKKRRWVRWKLREKWRNRTTNKQNQRLACWQKEAPGSPSMEKIDRHISA